MSTFSPGTVAIPGTSMGHLSRPLAPYLPASTYISKVSGKSSVAMRPQASIPAGSSTRARMNLGMKTRRKNPRDSFENVEIDVDL